MAYDPQGAPRTAGYACRDVRPVTAGDTRVGGVYLLDEGHSHVTQDGKKIVGLGAFAFAAAFGAEGGQGRHVALEFDDPVTQVVEAGEEL